jgi:MFS family permease
MSTDDATTRAATPTPPPQAGPDGTALQPAPYPGGPVGAGPVGSPEQEIRVPHRWRNLGLMTGASIVDSGDTSIVPTLFPTIQRALNLPLTALGTLTALGKVVGVVSGPAIVYLARRTNRKVVLATFSGLWGGWSILAALAQNYTQLLIMLLIALAGYAGASPITNELFSDLFGDRRRGRIAGYFYGTTSLVGSGVGAAVGQLSKVENGWRYGLAGAGVVAMLFGVAILIFFRDPGVGAAEPELSHLSRQQRDAEGRITIAKLGRLFRTRSFALMMIQRLLSGHLLIQSFGVVFLVQVRHLSNATAALVTFPFGLGYFCAAVFGGLLTDRIHQQNPRYGRIASLQVAQVGFAVVAFVATQLNWGTAIGIYVVLWFLMGGLQGINPGINRPIIMTVTPPELRGAAFAVMLSIFETIGWAVFNFLAGELGQHIGLQHTFLWILVVLMIVNGAFVTLLYRPYAQDSAAVRALLDRRAHTA